MFQLTPQFIPRHPKGGVVRAGKDAAHVLPIGRADERAAEVAGGGGELQFDSLGPGVPVDVAVGAVIRAQAAADAVALNLNLLSLAVAVNRIHGAAHKAVRIGTGAATAGDEPLVDPQAVADQPRDSLVRVATGFRALIAA